MYKSSRGSDLDTRLLRANVIKGVLEEITTANVNMVNADLLAEQRGLRIKETIVRTENPAVVSGMTVAIGTSDAKFSGAVVDGKITVAVRCPAAATRTGALGPVSPVHDRNTFAVLGHRACVRRCWLKHCVFMNAPGWQSACKACRDGGIHMRVSKTSSASCDVHRECAVDHASDARPVYRLSCLCALVCVIRTGPRSALTWPRACMQGDVTNGAPYLKSIGSFEVDVAIEGRVLLIGQEDRPGLIAAVAAVLAEDDVNVAFMTVSRVTKGTNAIMVLGIDSDPSAAALEKIKGVPGIKEWGYFRDL